jgi:hypothetical protein
MTKIMQASTNAIPVVNPRRNGSILLQEQNEDMSGMLSPEHIYNAFWIQHKNADSKSDSDSERKNQNDVSVANIIG